MAITISFYYEPSPTIKFFLPDYYLPYMLPPSVLAHYMLFPLKTSCGDGEINFWEFPPLDGTLERTLVLMTLRCNKRNKIKTMELFIFLQN